MDKKNYILCALIILAAILLLTVYMDKDIIINMNHHINGPAPEFKVGDNWLNSPPLTMSGLRGKVVLVEFWTYDCINCIHTLPYVTGWYSKYKDDGFVVVGVHTPEFSFEHDANNVKDAMKRLGIYYPVVQDNDYSIWNSYDNVYWPAEYLINQKGKIVYEHSGEGNYNITESMIRQLLGLSFKKTTNNLNNTDGPECALKEPNCKM